MRVRAERRLGEMNASPSKPFSYRGSGRCRSIFQPVGTQPSGNCAAAHADRSRVEHHVAQQPARLALAERCRPPSSACGWAAPCPRSSARPRRRTSRGSSSRGCIPSRRSGRGRSRSPSTSRPACRMSGLVLLRPGNGLSLRSSAHGQRGKAADRLACRVVASQRSTGCTAPCGPGGVISKSAPGQDARRAASPVQSANQRPAKPQSAGRCAMSWATTAPDRGRRVLDRVDALFEEQRDVLLGPDEGQLLLVLVELGRVVRAVVRAALLLQFRHDVADARLGLHVARALQPDADLGAVVAAEHGPVLDQGHLAAPAAPPRAPRTCRRCRRRPRPDRTRPPSPAARAGRAAARRNAAIAGSRFGGAKLRIGGEQDRVAAALEAGQVVQRQRRPRLPAISTCRRPASATRRPSVPKVVVERLAVDEHLERARRARRLPRAPPSPACGPRRGTCPAPGNSTVVVGIRRPAAQARAPAGRASPSGP